MSPVTLEGDTLGQKCKHYNKLVEDTIANKNYELRNISAEDSDIDNLLKIDVACKTRNVDYIIEVMKSNDMLYAATAIKKSTWLITEQQYANIINPEYLHTQLAPSMNTKTFNKLMLHVRLNLKDETRVETFYEYFKETDSAYKWLQNCSIPFIENVIKNDRRIPLSLFKRLCRRSSNFITYYYTRVEFPKKNAMRNEILVQLKSHTAEVLDMVENKRDKNILDLGKKKSVFLMKNCKQRILNNFDSYADTIDLSIVAKHLTKRKIKAFLYKQARRLGPRLHEYKTLCHFIHNMPKEEKFEFVKKTFIDKTKMALLFSEEERHIIESKIKPYQWYEFAPFDIALQTIKNAIPEENSPAERCAMLNTLITCARKNPRHIKALLEFVNNNHILKSLKFKTQFVSNLLSQNSTHEMDVETWNILDKLLHSMGVYTKSENNVQIYLQSIVLYKVLHDELVPEIVEHKMSFSTFEKIQKKLNQEQNRKMFDYLLNSFLTKHQIQNVSCETDLAENIVKLKNALTLLKDWKKDINRYPFVLEKIREAIKIKQENKWEIDTSCLYNVKKSWRRHMFEESLSLCLSEEACLNALKHKPQLLTRHDKQIDTLRTDDAVSLPRLLAKLRVYWPHSLAQHWVDAYLLNLSKPSGQKAAVRGLFMLLPQNQIIDMARKHAPDDFNINWGETDPADICLRKSIAQNLHLTRPLIPLDTVLLYAKGDYFQYAEPSLNAIVYNVSEVVGHALLPKLLDAPVDLRKFALHLVYFKFNSDDLKSIYSEVWKKTENLLFRTIIFQHTYQRMCKVKNPAVEMELWKLLSTFMVFVFSGSLGHVQNVPISVRGEYYIHSYKFFAALPGSANFESMVDDLIEYAPKIMDLLDSDFVVDEILSPTVFKFCLYESHFLEIFACYVLVGKSQDDQLQRFINVVEPAMGEAFQLWDSIHLGNYYIQINVEKFIKFLVWNFRLYFSLNKIPIPVKLFVAIHTKMEKELPKLKNYVVITSFKLLTEYLKIMDEDGSAPIVFENFKFSESDVKNGHMSNVMECVWKYFHLKTSPSFGSITVELLKNDTERYGPTINELFADAFQKMFRILVYNNILYFEYDESVLQTLKYMLDDNEFIPGYVLVSKVTPKLNKFSHNDLQCIQSEIRMKLRSHPSKTVQVHYFTDFRNVPKESPPVCAGLFKTLRCKICCELI